MRRRKFITLNLIGACWIGAAIVLPLLVAAPACADIIRLVDMWHGLVMTQAQCAAVSQAVWVSVSGRSFCMRYYLSTAGGQGSRPVVFLNGDAAWASAADRNKVPPPGLDIKDTDTDNVVRYADGMSKEQKMTAIYLARLGLDGSSGEHHALRHTRLELLATNAALEAIKRRHRFEGFHVYGQSGGSNLVAGLLELRSDIACAVPGSGGLARPNPHGIKPGNSDPAFQVYDAADAVATIARHRAARILVLTDPRDKLARPDMQNLFVEKLRNAGGEVEQFFVEATDEFHHGATIYAASAMRDCIRGASHDEIAADVAALVAKSLAAKVRDGTGAIVRTQDAPAPRVGALLNGIRYFGADYSNFWIGSAEPKLCQNACRSDAKCVAWTYVQPGVQGEQARCWLKDRMPPQQSQSAPCCTSGVERAEDRSGKRD
jgi:PAN domain